MKKGRFFEGDNYWSRHSLKSKTVRLTLEEIQFIEEYLPRRDFSYNLRTILEQVMRKTKNPEET